MSRKSHGLNVSPTWRVTACVMNGPSYGGKKVCFINVWWQCLCASGGAMWGLGAATMTVSAEVCVELMPMPVKSISCTLIR